MQALAPSLAERWEALAEALVIYRDVLDGRCVDGTVPPALETRGWATPLLSLGEEELSALEIGGHETEPPARFPASLFELRARASLLCSLPNLLPPPGEASRGLRRLEPPHQRDDEVGAAPPERRKIAPDARQGRLEKGRFGQVVKPDDRHVIGDAQAVFAQAFKGT